jgi:hypothetical protein
VLLAKDAGDDPLRDLLGAVVVGIGHEHDELVTAVARNDVAGADVVLDRRGDVAQNAVAVGVSVPIVDRLELVEVEHQHRER